MPAWQHFKNVCYHVRAADALGFHAAIFLTGHYGPNWEDLKTLLELIQPAFATRLYGLPDFEANTRGFEGHEGADHAGRVETSLSIEPSGIKHKTSGILPTSGVQACQSCEVIPL